jgi:hypothetical protein
MMTTDESTLLSYLYPKMTTRYKQIVGTVLTVTYLQRIILQ